MKNTALFTKLSTLALLGLAVGCSNGLSNKDTVNSSVSLPSSGNNFRLSLTDAPHPSLSHVIVNVDHVELLLAKGEDQGRVIVGQGLGQVDLLKLRDGVHLPIKDLNLRDGVVVKQFRLILRNDGNYIQRLADDSLCNLKTPSEQQTGLKLIMPGGGVEVEDNHVYSLIVDFDVDHSIVDNKNNCLLKPVLKVKSLTDVPSQDDNSGTTTTTTTTSSTTTTEVPTTTTTVPTESVPPESTSTTTTTLPAETTTTTTTLPPSDISTGTDSGTNTTQGSDITTTGGETVPVVDIGNPTFFNP